MKNKLSVEEMFDIMIEDVSYIQRLMKAKSLKK